MRGEREQPAQAQVLGVRAVDLVLRVVVLGELVAVGIRPVCLERRERRGSWSRCRVGRCGDRVDQDRRA